MAQDTQQLIRMLLQALQAGGGGLGGLGQMPQGGVPPIAPGGGIGGSRIPDPRAMVGPQVGRRSIENTIFAPGGNAFTGGSPVQGNQRDNVMNSIRTIIQGIQAAAKKGKKRKLEGAPQDSGTRAATLSEIAKEKASLLKSGRLFEE